MAERLNDTFWDRVKKTKDVRPNDGPMALPVGHVKKYELAKYPTAKRRPPSIQGGSMK